jgi:hypothetical protein
MIGKPRNPPASVVRPFPALLLAAALAALGSNAPRAVTAEPSARLTAALETARNPERPERERLIAIRRLGDADYATVAPALFDLLDARQSEALRMAVIRAFEELADPRAVPSMLTNWPGLPPSVKQQALHAFTSRPALAGAFLAELQHGRLALAEVDTATRQRLAALSDDALATRSRKLFERQPLLDARATLNRFRPALALRGDARRGKETFKARACVNCHRIGDEGHFVGADLFTIKDMPREELHQKIVAPNLFFMPTCQAFVA